jgi:hypothetical protein
MLVFHVGAIRSAWFALDGLSGDAEWLSSGFRFLILIGSAVFFALKIADVSWLRLKPGWRSAISSLVIVALLHVSVVDRAVEGELSYSPVHLGVVFFVGSLVEFDGLRQGVLRIRGLAAHKLTGLRPALSSFACFHRGIDSDSLGPLQWLITTLVLSPRPPPLS